MGRDRKNERRTEHFTQLVRSMMESAAWRGLSPTAQALYPWIRLEWRGPKANNNGSISLSTRQAAERMGIGVNTAARAFHDLQAKGFLVLTRAARLGVSGHATAPEYELTEIALPHAAVNTGRRLYLQWRAGSDFPVHKSPANNPTGKRAKQNPVIKLVTPCHQNGDEMAASFHQNSEGTSSKR